MQALRVASDWVLRRVFKALLKRNLAQILATDLDLEQLTFQLDKGSLELKDCLLDAKYLNEQLENDLYEIESALIGKISVNLFDFCILVEDVGVTVKHRDGEKNRPTNSRSREYNPGFNDSGPWHNNNEGQGTTTTAVDEGVTLISSLVQKLLKKLKVEGRNIGMKAKLAQGQLLTINLNSVAISDAEEGVDELKTVCDVAKACSFSGFAVQLTSANDSASEVLASMSYDSTGCSGNVIVGWVFDDLRSLTIDARASFNGACVWMSPAAVPVVSDILEMISTSREQSRSSRETHTSDHPLSRSMLVAEAASSSNIVKALMLPNGERLLKEELAHQPGAHAGEEMDEFFDALSASVTDYMAQSFFSTASTAFAEASSRPPSPLSEASSPLHDFFGSNDQVFPSRSMDVVFQLELEVHSFELWLACRSGLIGSADPWCMRLNMQGLSIRQVHEVSCTALTASINSIDVSEYTPIEANRSKFHDIGQFEALFELFAKHCDLPNTQGYFHGKTAFADTIRRLEHLKLADGNYWCPPDNYEMSPILACAATNKPAISLIIERSMTPSPSLAARVLLLEIHSWLNAPMLARIEELLSSFAAGFSLRPSEAQVQEVKLDLDFSLHLSALTLCFFAPNAAIAVRVLAGVSIDDLCSDFHKRGPRWNQAVCSPFFALHHKSEGTMFQLYADRVQIYNMASEDLGGSIEIAEGGFADALTISCSLNMPLDLQTLATDVPTSVAILIDGSNTTTASQIKIAGDIFLNISPISLRSVTDISSSFAAYSRPRDSSGAFQLQIDRFTLKFLGPLVLQCNDVQMLHLLDSNSLTVGSTGTICLRGDLEWPYISTSGSEARAVTFAIADRCKEGSHTIEKQLVLQMIGVIFAEDFLREKQFWSEFEYLTYNIPVESPGRSAQAFALEVVAKDLLILHMPSGEHSQVAAGLYLQAFSAASQEFSDIRSQIDGASIYLREDAVAYSAPLLPLPIWLQKQGFLLTAREKEIQLERRLERIGGATLLLRESISVRTHALDIRLNKESAALLKSFAELPASHKPSEEAYEKEGCKNSPEIPADTIGDALVSDVRNPDEPNTALNGNFIVDIGLKKLTGFSTEFLNLFAGAWYEEEALGVEHLLGSLGPEECSFSKEDACVGGNGAYFVSSYEYIRDYVRRKGGARCDIIPAKEIAVAVGTVTLVIFGTVSPEGTDILEGSVQVKVENSEASLRLHPGVKVLYDCACSIQRLSMRHDIHPQTVLCSPWHDVFTCPQLRNKGSREQLVAFSCEVESSKSHSERADLVIRAKCSPVQVRLDQYLLLFAQEFVDAITLDTWQSLKVIEEDEELHIVEESEEFAAHSGGVSAYIQRCNIAGFAIKISYVPNYVDMTALRKGNYVELLNMVPEWKANLWLRELEICAAENFSSLGTLLAARWMQDILAFQARNFLLKPFPGAPSVRIGAIGKSLSDFAALPATPSKRTLRQLKKAVLALLRLLANEVGHEVGATVAGAWKSRS